ncbi:MAG: 50S ribosomal protein L11 methyltransferase [Clostridia bacterium]
MANINAPTIISRSNSLARLTAPWGELIISGIYGEQVEPVIAALRESFEELSRAREGDWYGVRLVRGED